MKHLVAKEHHSHLKKRALLELFGLAVLIWISIDQRELLTTTIQSIRESDVLFLLLLFSLHWLMLPLTPISYRLLSDRKIPLATTCLAQLAAAGPGRIIPGGLGHISIASVHLKRVGIKIQKAIVITVANNVIGLMVNSVIVLIAVLFHPTLLGTITGNVSPQNIILLAVAILTFFALLQWLSHIRKTRKTVSRVNREWKHLFSHLMHNPHNLVIVILIAGIITTGHMAMLLLAGEALSVHIAPSDAFIALGTGVLLGGAVPTPGGLGAVEAGTTSALIVLGYDPAQAVSIAILFRTATYWQPLIPGTISYLYLRERKLL